MGHGTGTPIEAVVDRMYTRCHLCDHALGSNDQVAHMPVGRRLAYDTERGRLWVVCPRCDEWNLTPPEVRWEAIEECERIAERAEVRVSGGGVSLVRLGRLELVRIGAGMPDDIANWRYGSRLRRRRAGANTRAIAAGALGGALLGGSVLLGLSTGSGIVTLYLLVVGASAGGYWGRVAASPWRSARLGTADGATLKLRPRDLRDVCLTREPGTGGRRGVRLLLSAAEKHPLAQGDGVLGPLAAILPLLNREGATEEDLRRAVEVVERAERDAAASEQGGRVAKPAWLRIALAERPESGLLSEMPTHARLALEMAVTEELERRAIAGEAEGLAPRWRAAEEVAGIADDMFLPAFVTDWLRKHRR